MGGEPKFYFFLFGLLFEDKQKIRDKLVASHNPLGWRGGSER